MNTRTENRPECPASFKRSQGISASMSSECLSPSERTLLLLLLTEQL